MFEKNLLQKLQKIISNCEGSILYKPIKNEIDYTNSFFPLKILTNAVTLPNNKKEDPFLWVDKCKNIYGNKNLYILIPGNQFDMSGARHGKGGGWYDRFLSKAPSTWIKIGIARQSQISLYPIKREKWDVPMDWLLVNSENGWSAYNTKK